MQLERRGLDSEGLDLRDMDQSRSVPLSQSARHVTRASVGLCAGSSGYGCKIDRWYGVFNLFDRIYGVCGVFSFVSFNLQLFVDQV